MSSLGTSDALEGVWYEPTSLIYTLLHFVTVIGRVMLLSIIRSMGLGTDDIDGRLGYGLQVAIHFVIYSR